MKDARGNVLYVGKASVLRNRLRTYFGSSTNLPNKIRRMLEQLDDFECIVTDSEAEALILENTLIKRYRPRYNARLKDDKTYPFLKIDLKEEFPRVYITRRVLKDGARYFGPFATAGTVRKTMDLIKKLFPYRSCTKQITGKDPRPCLEYYINRCVAPCTGFATKEEYQHVIQQVILFMEGDTETVTNDLSANMELASENLEFERAAILRDRMRAVEKVAEDFVGTYAQRPPPFSAKKIGGVRAYRLARRRRPVDPAPVNVTVHTLDILNVTASHIRCRVSCEPGFYMRALAHDLGTALGCGACLESLHRERSGPFGLDQAVTLDALEGAKSSLSSLLLPIADLLPNVPKLLLTAHGTKRASHGNDLLPSDVISSHREWGTGLVRLCDEQGTLVAIARADTTLLLRPLIVLV